MTDPVSLRVRDAVDADLPTIQSIYAEHVLHGFGSFEELPPDLEEMRGRFENITRRAFPYLVAEEAGRILAFAYAAPYRPRPAYRHSVEDSVYVASDAQRRGCGRALLSSLIERMERAGYRQMVAIVGDSGNAGSIELHRSLGFELRGQLNAVGFKHGRWVDVVILQRALGEGAQTPPNL